MLVSLFRCSRTEVHDGDDDVAVLSVSLDPQLNWLRYWGIKDAAMAVNGYPSDIDIAAFPDEQVSILDTPSNLPFARARGPESVGLP